MRARRAADTLVAALLLLTGAAVARAAWLQAVFPSLSRSAATYTSSCFPADGEEVITVLATNSAGSGNVTVTLQTSPDSTCSPAYDLGNTGALSSGQSAVLSKTEYDGLALYYRVKAVVASAATTFRVDVVGR